MKYTEKIVAGKVIKRIESDYIPILKGHLVFEENAFFYADIVASSNDRIDYAAVLVNPMTKENLLDLKDCIDKVLSTFEKI